jgi:hypothetical protein
VVVSMFKEVLIWFSSVTYLSYVWILMPEEAFWRGLMLY